MTMRLIPLCRSGPPLNVAVALLLSLGGAGKDSPAQQPGVADDRVYLDIIQRKDKDLRRQRLEQLLKTLNDPRPDAAEQARALSLLARVADIPFDRQPFLPAVKALLRHPRAVVRSAAVQAMPTVGGGPADLRDIARL